jgi:hypothetical protein
VGRNLTVSTTRSWQLLRHATHLASSPPPTHTPLQKYPKVRHIIYSKGLEAEFDIVSPMTVGGLTSDAYRAMNPQGKMPLLLLPDGTALPESEVPGVWRGWLVVRCCWVSVLVGWWFAGSLVMVRPVPQCWQAGC